MKPRNKKQMYDFLLKKRALRLFTASSDWRFCYCFVCITYLVIILFSETKSISSCNGSQFPLKLLPALPYHIILSLSLLLHLLNPDTKYNITYSIKTKLCIFYQPLQKINGIEQIYFQMGIFIYCEIICAELFTAIGRRLLFHKHSVFSIVLISAWRTLH